jgi:AcrR family transcriptional regulator
MPDGSDGIAAVRRAPFAESPNLGPRGQRTRQKIVDAALRIFAQHGYHQCSIDRITSMAGCSRVSFYQYFAGKEDLFRDLAGQVARQLSASIEALTLLTPDVAGWEALRAWVGRYSDIYTRYSPVFHAFPAAVVSDDVVAGGSVRVGRHHVQQFHSVLVTTDLPPRRLDPVIDLLMESLALTHDAAEALQSVAPAAFPLARLQDAFTDVAHRTLFGRDDAVNVRTPAPEAIPTLGFSPVMQRALAEAHEAPHLTEPRLRTRRALMHAGRDEFVRRGFKGTRVDDITDAAGLSHGTFYRYFDSSAHLADVLVAEAMQRVSTAFAEIPRATGAPAGATRPWLRRYNAAHVDEAALLRVWLDDAMQDPVSRADAAAAIDQGRRLLARFLDARGFGDVGVEAVVMVAVVSAFGSAPRDAVALDAAAYVVERGLLGSGS